MKRAFNKIIFAIVAILMLFYATSCEDYSYYDSAYWNGSEEEFENECIPFYISKFNLLAEKYGIRYELKEEWFETRTFRTFRFTAYNDSFSVICWLPCNSYSYAAVNLDWYYYNENVESLYDYENQRVYVEFINDFIRSICFMSKHDEKDNYFEWLFFDILENDYKYDSRSFKFHYDEIVGQLMYLVCLNSKNAKRYYKMQYNEEADIYGNAYKIVALLNPLVLEESFD